MSDEKVPSTLAPPSGGVGAYQRKFSSLRPPSLVKRRSTLGSDCIRLDSVSNSDTNRSASGRQGVGLDMFPVHLGRMLPLVDPLDDDDDEDEHGDDSGARERLNMFVLFLQDLMGDPHTRFFRAVEELTHEFSSKAKGEVVREAHSIYTEFLHVDPLLGSDPGVTSQSSRSGKRVKAPLNMVTTVRTRIEEEVSLEFVHKRTVCGINSTHVVCSTERRRRYFLGDSPMGVASHACGYTPQTHIVLLH